MEGEPEYVPRRDGLDGHARGHRHGEGVHGQTEGKTQQGEPAKFHHWVRRGSDASSEVIHSGSGDPVASQ